ncbi:MAG: hypothetical protein II921_06995 [Treponema sp.]|nr:hypothetical protein [Treponema sp.]
MKKILLAIAVILASAVASAEHFPMAISDSGSHTFETTIKDLASHRLREEVVIKNKSSIDLRNIGCTIMLNGEAHEMQSIPYLSRGKHDNFKGQRDEEMKDEMKIFFGEDGKFKSSNKNRLTFVFSFGDQNEKVRLSKVYKHGKDIYFEVMDK